MELHPRNPYGEGAPVSAWNDQVRREGRHAVARTVVNTLVTLADFVPVGGDAVSWGADGLKATRRTIELVSRVPGLRWVAKGTDFLDLTPDVSLSTAIFTEVGEFLPPFGVFPSHAVEGGIQYFGHDKERIRAGREKRREQRQGLR